ncbi:MAG: FAD-dependent oxidoreductase [Alphaproteobacteria bacterium]|nr:MAG: FAD-dependent oxidoreductase [Alphaproteobacteria bacterium]
MVETVAKDELEWRGNAPVAPRFGDVYYSAENGLEETRFVFIEGTGAPAIWQDRDHFVIAETGFGTGLNFLATWKAWKESGTRGRLTFISVEGYPLDRAALAAAHATFPEVAPFAEQLSAAWPPPAAGFHTRHFEDGQITLILMFGTAEQAFSSLSAHVDAWYLDGFAPARNPDMWSDAVLDQIARLSHTGTRFATFTAAGFVRRGLQARGFHVDKVPGYGRKRERLVGVMETPTMATGAPCPDWALPGAPMRDGPVAVIGAGIAGASVAAALVRRGRQVTMVAGTKPVASHVPAAILAPRFLLDDQPVASFFTSAHAYAAAFPPFAGTWAAARGIDQLPKGDESADRLARVATHLKWGADWLQPNTEGFHLPMGGSLDTRAALAALLSGIPMVKADIDRLEATDAGWRLLDQDGNTVHEAPNVVVAAGLGSGALAGTGDHIELRPNRGQVECVDVDRLAALPACSFAFGGYVTAAIDGGRTIGSTFDRLHSVCDTDYAPQPEDRQRILTALAAATGCEVPDDAISHSWAGVRATTADHLPFAGAVPDWQAAADRYQPMAIDARAPGLGAPDAVSGLYMLTGLGSKGYQYGPLLGDYLAALMTGEPLPLPMDLLPAVSPLRGFIRRLVRSG